MRDCRCVLTGDFFKVLGVAIALITAEERVEVLVLSKLGCDFRLPILNFFPLSAIRSAMERNRVSAELEGLAEVVVGVVSTPETSERRVRRPSLEERSLPVLSVSFCSEAFAAPEAAAIVLTPDFRGLPRRGTGADCGTCVARSSAS